MINSVTNRQMVFIIFLTLSTYTTIDLPKVMAETAGRSSWIPILIVSLIFALAATIITKLNNMYQNKVLFDYGQEIVGKFFTYLIIFYKKVMMRAAVLSTLVVARGKTLSEARHDLDIQTDKPLYFSGVRAVIFTESFAKEYLVEYLYRFRADESYRKKVQT